MKISEVKSNLQIIITNLKQLQTHRENLIQNNSVSEIAKIAECKQSLELSFAGLESESLEKVLVQLKRRKTRRARRTSRLKLKKTLQKSSSNCQYELPSNSCIAEQQPLSTLRRKELRSAKKYLSIMESLETLHQLRGGGDTCKLKESLSQIRSIWHSTAQKISAEKQNTCSIQSQWNQVLFGGNSEVEMKYGMRDLIERRSIWDSYLVSEDDSTGSHIPIGWVYPKENARPEWKQFKLSI